MFIDLRGSGHFVLSLLFLVCITAEVSLSKLYTGRRILKFHVAWGRSLRITDVVLYADFRLSLRNIINVLQNCIVLKAWSEYSWCVSVCFVRVWCVCVLTNEPYHCSLPRRRAMCLPLTSSLRRSCPAPGLYTLGTSSCRKSATSCSSTREMNPILVILLCRLILHVPDKGNICGVLFLGEKC